MMRGKDRAALRKAAHHLEAIVHVGQGGVTAAVIASLDDALRTHELVKVQLGKHSIAAGGHSQSPGGCTPTASVFKSWSYVQRCTGKARRDGAELVGIKEARMRSSPLFSLRSSLCTRAQVAFGGIARPMITRS